MNFLTSLTIRVISAVNRRKCPPPLADQSDRVKSYIDPPRREAGFGIGIPAPRVITRAAKGADYADHHSSLN